MNIEIALLRKEGNGYRVVRLLNERYNGMLYIEQYETDNDLSYLQLGIRLVDAEAIEKYSVYIERIQKKALIYDSTSGYFIEASVENQIGVSEVGFVSINVYDKKCRRLCMQENILIKPAIIEWYQFEQMVDLIKNIDQELIVDKNAYVSMAFNDGILSLSSYINKLLKSIKSSLESIDFEPAVELKKEYAKIKHERLKRYNNKILIQQAFYPNKRKYVAEQTRETTEIYENRIIYFTLVRIGGLIATSTKKYNIQSQKLEQESTRIIEVLKNAYELDYIKHLEVKQNRIKEQIQWYNNEIKIWNENKDIINGYLNLKLFKCYKNKRDNRELLRLTANFIHDIRYKHIYSLLNEFYNNVYNEADLIKKDMLGIKEMYEVFEIWTLFEMIRVLVTEQGWRLRNYNISRLVKNYRNKYGNLYGFTVRLEHKLPDNRQVNLSIVYNKTLHLENQNLRPDYTFEYECLGKNMRFYLDAKYHAYNSSINSVYNDIDQIAIGKYLNPLEGTEYRAIGSFIVHCVDKQENIFYGGRKGRYHRAGGFSLTPNNSIYFLTWICLCMEYFFREYTTCWACGSIDVKEEESFTMGDKKKYYYTCNHCKSFWVKTHCNHCENQLIVKHDLPQKQYHKLTSEKWMVHCPVCDSTGGVNQTMGSMLRKVQREVKCSRCGGTGYIGVYRHIEGGICFDCKGSGVRRIYE